MKDIIRTINFLMGMSVFCIAMAVCGIITTISEGYVTIASHVLLLATVIIYNLTFLFELNALKKKNKKTKGEDNNDNKNM